MKLTESNPEQHEHEDLPSFHLLLMSGMTVVKFLRSWLSHVVEKYQLETLRSYLMSLNLFYKFLSQEQVSFPNVTKDLLNAVLKRKLEKHDEDYTKLLSSEGMPQGMPQKFVSECSETTRSNFHRNKSW